MASRLKVANFIAAIEGSKGIKSVICENVPCAANTLTKWMNKHPTILAAYNTECAIMLGVAHSVVTGNIERALRDLITNPDGIEPVDSADAKWYLSKKGRHEGFGSDEAPNITVNAGFNFNDWRKQARERVKQVDDL